MTDAGRKVGWEQEDSGAVTRGVAKAVEEALAQEVPQELGGEQAGRLRTQLAEALPGEVMHAVRRQVRRFLDEERRLRRIREKAEVKAGKVVQTVQRLSLQLRIQHMILFSSCIILIVTGLPIKFHETAAASFIMGLFGGPEAARYLHRVGAIGLTCVGVYHVLYSMFAAVGRRDFGLLIPKPQDVKDFFHQMGFFLGIKKDKPLYGRFSYIEKFDYWAVYWGMVVMITSGYIMWFKDAAINQFGKVVYDIGREAHSDEALLATLAIVIWHFYNVHFNPHKFPGSLTWWNGKITMDEFREEHPLEYEEWLKEKRPEGGAEVPAGSAGGHP